VVAASKLPSSTSARSDTSSAVTAVRSTRSFSSRAYCQTAITRLPSASVAAGTTPADPLRTRRVTGRATVKPATSTLTHTVQSAAGVGRTSSAMGKRTPNRPGE